MNKLVKRIAVLVTAAVMGVSMLACGDSASEADYIAETEKLVEAMDAVSEKADALDPDDLEGAKALLEEVKAPLVEFAALEAPERFAEAHAKYKSGCEAMIEYLDMTIDALDPEKAAELDVEKYMSLIATAEADLTEADTLMEEAVK